jgi:hypothetical protein
MKLAVDDRNYGSLVDEIVEAAEGVFLWVRIACDSLLAGITNEDNIHDLQLRLRKLPHDLRKLYRYLLDTVQPEYQQKSARSLLFTICSSYRPLVLAYHYLDDGERLKFEERGKDRLQVLVPSIHKSEGENRRFQLRTFASCRQWQMGRDSD